MAGKAIMVQGTMSNSGKTFVTAGLCRIFKQDGYRVAPFKSQNMALNSYITKEGLEIGRAQAMQAEAAMIEPTHHMNPILLKPTSSMGSQVIVDGEVYDNLSALDYYDRKDLLRQKVMADYQYLANHYDRIVIEGAGSPAEINLAENDIVNMGMAEMADAPVLLVADIDRGGVFASVYGTVKLLPTEQQKRIKGIIINKFRGDVELLKPGLTMLENLTGIPVVGILPMEKIDVDDEDSLSDRLNQKTVKEGIDVAVIRLPHISNFTDFSVFEMIDGVSLRYVTDKKELGQPDLILLPGTKNTMGDMEWLTESGLGGAIIRESEHTRVIGICGGFQLLGKEMSDPHGVEHGGTMQGLGLLDTATIFEKAKTRTRIHGTIREEKNLYGLSNLNVEGYEIHMGTTTNLGNAVPMITLEDGRCDALATEDGRIWGSYLHGIFDNEDLVFGLVYQIMKEKGINPDENHLSVAEYKEIQYNKLADLLRNHLDMEYIHSLFVTEAPECIPEECKNCSAVGCGGKQDSHEGLGRVHIYCGDGKGKTTASTGLAVRCAGAGNKVLMYQFIKNNSSSEVEILTKIPGITRVDSLPIKRFVFMMSEEEKAELKRQNDAKLDELIELSKSYDMIVLDEAVYAMKANVLSEEKVLNWLKTKPRNLEVVLTGRNPSEQLVEAADYVSEIQKIKHPFDMGLSSRVGIEK